jgi:general stress protein 26
MTTQSKANSQQQFAEHNFREVLRKFDSAMLVTPRTAGSGLHARPMMIADTGEDGSLWFLTGADTPKVYELAEADEVLAVMQSSSRWLSVTGNAALSQDRARIDQLWKEPFKAWFTGKDDPKIVVVHLRPSEAEYWDNSGLQGFKFALRAAAALVSGKVLKPGDEDVKTHAKVPL